ncbi:Bestrophin, RFP-TM, chloride channel-domain-containing protein [Collybia nuda]|uniref:Bestrophin, RFP-TM, chloride channel-domain-containing protein n=1 Tax=Collybia nuda TaxID=64659 RepID=A0A9P6CFD4_9AGAR|nr:Bestrophin, RFP-TM, chloride channel-domain-containing protein [Collybia nuda]
MDDSSSITERQGSQTRQSSTHHHTLLPASRPASIAEGTYEAFSQIPTYSLISWTFGRGSVIWRIWPAVLLHTTFAAVIVTLSVENVVNLEIPNIMLTVLGVVIGFVISYRASSGYDRYWMGRTCWSDVIRNSRTIGRFIWFHVPPRLSAKSPDEIATGRIKRSPQEMTKVMAEKRVALDLVEGFAVALKHHIRGELGIYYEDLYHLVRPLHEHEHSTNPTKVAKPTTTSTRKVQQISAQARVPNMSQSPIALASSSSPLRQEMSDDPKIPPINTYGTFVPPQLTSHKRKGSYSSTSSSDSESSYHSLLPSTQPQDETFWGTVSAELIPFSSIVTMIRSSLSTQKPLEVLPPNLEVEQDVNGGHVRRWQGPIHQGQHVKHRPIVAGGGQNLPLEILRCLSEWVSVLEDRGSVPGSSLGPMIAAIAAFEENLTTLEKILTTPLPLSSYELFEMLKLAYDSTVWLYLFFLPFQLIKLFGYYTIPGVAMAAFIYLGFLAAGEEIEQPFGYDDNDLDLDLFCSDIIHNDIEHLKTSPCLNAYFGPARADSLYRPPMGIVEVSESTTMQETVDSVVLDD